MPFAMPEHASYETGYVPTQDHAVYHGDIPSPYPATHLNESASDSDNKAAEWRKVAVTGLRGRFNRERVSSWILSKAGDLRTDIENVEVRMLNSHSSAHALVLCKSQASATQIMSLIHGSLFEGKPVSTSLTKEAAPVRMAQVQTRRSPSSSAATLDSMTEALTLNEPAGDRGKKRAEATPVVVSSDLATMKQLYKDTDLGDKATGSRGKNSAAASSSSSRDKQKDPSRSPASSSSSASRSRTSDSSPDKRRHRH